MISAQRETTKHSFWSIMCRTVTAFYSLSDTNNVGTIAVNKQLTHIFAFVLVLLFL